MIVSNQKHSWVHCRHTQHTCHESCKQWAAKEWPTVIMSLTRSCNVCSMLLVVNSRNDIKWHRETAEKEILLWTGKGELTLAEHSVSVQFSCSVMSSHAQLTLCETTHGYMQGLPVHHRLLEFTHSCPLSRWCHPITSSSVIPTPPTLIFPNIRFFSNASVLSIRWLNYWSFSFSISPSNEYPGLISFRMDWLDLLAVQGTLKSLLQHHSSKASILWC